MFRIRSGQRHARTLELLEERVVFDAAAAEYAPLDTFETAEDLRDYLLEVYREEWENSRCVLLHHRLVLNDTVNFSAADVGPVSHSETNVQVAGIDEADLVETDGRYIYTLSGDSLVIVESWPVDELRVVSRTQLSGESRSMFLHGDRLTIISSGEFEFPQFGETGGGATSDVFSPRPESFVVATLDISDRAAPSLISTTVIEGQLYDARMIDGKLVVQSNMNIELPRRLAESVRTDLLQPCYFAAPDDDDLRETWEEFVERVTPGFTENALPNYQTLDADGNVTAEGLLVTPSEVHAGYIDDVRRITSLSVIDVAGEALLVDAGSVFTETNGWMYANSDSILVMPKAYSFSGGTAIFQVDIHDGQLAWTASGVVKGNLFNSFSVDIHDGYIRAATTGTFAESNLYVLQQHDDALEVIGSLEDFAPGETVFGVRFQGEVGFAITATELFDPLFAFDLSDPSAPSIIDHLEMPGVSRYLHPAGNDYLIGVGADATWNWGGPINPRISLFDVSNHSDLSLAEHLILTRETVQDIYQQSGTELPAGASSFSFEPDHEHHTVNYDPQSGLLAITLNYRSGQPSRHTDLLVFQVDTLAGSIESVGVIRHDGRIERSVFIDDKIYSVSQQAIKVHDPAAIDQVIGSLNFGEDPIDVNRDGKVAISDMLTIVAELRVRRFEGEGISRMSALNHPLLDVDADGSVTVGDALFIANSIKNSWNFDQFRERFPALSEDSRNRIDRIDLRFDVLPVNANAQANDSALEALLAENG